MSDVIERVKKIVVERLEVDAEQGQPEARSSTIWALTCSTWSSS